MAVGCGVQSQDKVAETTPNECQAESNALSASTNLIDLGSISADDIVSASTKISNEGNADIKLTEVATDCSCVEATVSSDVVNGNGTATLRLEYDAQGVSGKQFHKVTIDANNGQQIEIIVVADVE